MRTVGSQNSPLQDLENAENLLRKISGENFKHDMNKWTAWFDEHKTNFDLKKRIALLELGDKAAELLRDGKEKEAIETFEKAVAISPEFHGLDKDFAEALQVGGDGCLGGEVAGAEVFGLGEFD